MPEERRLVIDVGQRHRALDLNAPIWKDVAQLGAAVAKHLANEKPAMALLWSPAAA